MSFFERLIRNHPLANIAFVVVLFMGYMAYRDMPREQDPEVNFNWVNITTRLPGASAEDVEKRVTRPLEEAVARVADVKFISSNSRENVSSMLVRFQELNERTFDKRMNDLRREVQNQADAELPPEASDPAVLEITTANGFPTAMVMITSPAFDERLRSLARRVKEDLERTQGVDSVLATGLQDPELHVRFAPAAAAARGISGSDVADSVSRWFRDVFAGQARVGDNEWLVRVIGQSSDPDTLARIEVIPAASPHHRVPLDTVADVARAREKPEQRVNKDGRPAVLLAVNKRTGANTLELVARINDYLAARNGALVDSGLQVVLLDDQTIPTRQAIDVMETNALYGLMLVLLITWLFLGSRIAILVGLGIPFSLAAAFWALSAMDFTLNISVLLGIVIVLGMLVDDAVVIVEAIYYRMVRGQAILQASLDGVREVGMPVFSSVLTTLAAFLPLMLLPGIVGKFMFVIPAVVSIALLASLLEAYWMLPTHVVAMRPDTARPSRVQKKREAFTHWVRLKYSRFLIKTMRHPWLSLAGLGLLLTLAIGSLAGGLVKTQFFAFDPLRIFYVNVDMPPSSSVDATLAEVQRVERAVRQKLEPNEARGISANAGLKFTDTEPLYGPAYGQIVVSLNPRSGDMRTTDEVVADMRAEIEALSGKARISFLEVSGGPPASKPIKVRARGDDYKELRAAADAIESIVRKIPGTQDIADDEVAGRQQLILRLDANAVRNAGLDPALVSRLARLHTDGEIVAEMREGGDKIEVRVLADREPMADIAELLNDPVPLPGGGTTTLSALTEAETGTSQGVIKRYNLRRAITVEANLDKENEDAPDTIAANRIIQQEWNKIAARYPGVTLDYSGELEDVQESLDAMPGLFLLGIGLIYLILAAQFKSYWQPLMILVTVPLAFTGVTLGLVITQNPLSLYTMYGIIALTGIAVNSAIVLIDAANERLKSGMGILHASIYAARRRVIPILITTTTTIGGLFSLAAGLGGKSLIWGPMASSLVWGLTVATLLTLFVMPLIYRLAMVRSNVPGPAR
ncbi:MAG: efflux RND transporter permease subunit [Pseudomonadota bacterium]